MPDAVQEEASILFIKDVSKGVNNYLFAGNILDNQSVEQEDIDISKPGLRRKRDGYALIANDTSDAAKCFVTNFRPDNASEELLMHTSNKLYKWTGSGNWSSVGTFPWTNGDISSFQADSRVYFVEQSNNVRSYDGATITDEGNTNTDPPRGNVGAYMLGRAFISGNTSSPNKVWYSSISAGTGLGSGSWDRTNNSHSFNIGAGSRIVAISPFRQTDLIVFAEHSIWALNVSPIGTPGSWTITNIHPNIGCKSRRSVAVVGNDLIFMDQYGHIRSLIKTIQDTNAGVNPLPISQHIDGSVQNFNDVYLSNAAGIGFDRFYFLSVTYESATTNNKVFVYDTVLESWTGPWNNWTATNFAVSTVESGNRYLYFGNAGAASKVFRYTKDRFNDNSTAIAFKEVTKKYDFGNSRTDKTWNSVEVMVNATNGTTITVEAQIDDEGWVSVGSFQATGGGPTLPIALPYFLGGSGVVKRIFNLDALLGRGRFIQFRITNSEVDKEVEIIQVVVTGYVENVDFGSPAA